MTTQQNVYAFTALQSLLRREFPHEPSVFVYALVRELLEGVGGDAQTIAPDDLVLRLEQWSEALQRTAKAVRERGEVKKT